MEGEASGIVRGIFQGLWLGPLLLIGDELLYNPRLHKAYRIEDGIPVLLVDEAVDVGPDEHERLMAQVNG